MRQGKHPAISALMHRRRDQEDKVQDLAPRFRHRMTCSPIRILMACPQVRDLHRHATRAEVSVGMRPMIDKTIADRVEDMKSQKIVTNTIAMDVMVEMRESHQDAMKDPTGRAGEMIPRSLSSSSSSKVTGAMKEEVPRIEAAQEMICRQGNTREMKMVHHILVGEAAVELRVKARG